MKHLNWSGITAEALALVSVRSLDQSKRVRLSLYEKLQTPADLMQFSASDRLSILKNGLSDVDSQVQDVFLKFLKTFVSAKEEPWEALAELCGLTDQWENLKMSEVIRLLFAKVLSEPTGVPSASIRKAHDLLTQNSLQTKADLQTMFTVLVYC